ncbi:hypothetical protein [Streptomyces bohaiensis]|uniref:hypothetical protein n=1 Tax=Streptomyces bohaiensis TaxID=1431344 RepID=UPI003B81BE83
MTATQLQEQFRLTREDWRRIASSPDMVDPSRSSDTGTTRWSAADFARWLAAAHPSHAAWAPHLLHPIEGVSPRYLGGLHLQGPPEAFAGLWATPHGAVAVCYPRNQIDPKEALTLLPEAASVVVVDHSYNAFDLPDLMALDRRDPSLPYGVRWSELTAHVGSRVPWWPSQLRRASHMTQWQPSDGVAEVEVVTSPSWEPLYELALSEAKGTPLRTALLSIGREMQQRAVSSATSEIADVAGSSDLSEDYKRRRKTQQDCLVIVARPKVNDFGSDEVVNLDQGHGAEVVRAGVADLWARPATDLSVECLTQLHVWSAQYMPFGAAFAVEGGRSSPAQREWLARLSAVEPTTAHRAAGQRVVGALMDPVVGCPVTSREGRSLSELDHFGYAPRRLPAGTTIQEVILDGPVWVRDQNGTLWPAPSMDAPGVSWGHSGSGPRALATLIGRLLDDGGTHALTYGSGKLWGVEPQLEEFFELPHKRGTRLPRRLLETVRSEGHGGLGWTDPHRYLPTS